MKTLKIFYALAFVGVLTLTSCREKETTIVKEVEVERVDTDDEGILERAAKKVDKKVNDEIDEEIEKIGDDN